MVGSAFLKNIASISKYKAFKKPNQLFFAGERDCII
jgi:hypothetical protein